MKKTLLLVWFAAGLGALAYAGTYQVTTTPGQDNRLEKERNRLNKASCQAVNLPQSCTQAQCRNVNPNCDIYSDIADLIDRNIVRSYANSLRVNDTRDDQAQFCAFWSTATQPQKNQVCADSGLPNGCELCL